MKFVLIQCCAIHVIYCIRDLRSSIYCNMSVMEYHAFIVTDILGTRVCGGIRFSLPGSRVFPMVHVDFASAMCLRASFGSVGRYVARGRGPVPDSPRGVLPFIVLGRHNPGY